MQTPDIKESLAPAPILRIAGLRTEFGSPAQPVRAVDDVSLDIRRGEIVGLVGESGSGKSVTGFSIMGLLDGGRIAGGQILFDGEDIAQASSRRLRTLRGKRIAMIFQDPMMTLNPVLRIDTQMIEAITAHEKVSTAVARQRACDALAKVGIPSPQERLRAYPHQFSGGMRQRVAIAIALLHNPDLIIADEPTTALDVTIQAQILSQVQKLAREHNTAWLWITHDLAVVSRLADRLGVMYAGRIIESGTVKQVLGSPRHPYTMGLLNSVPDRNERGRPLSQIRGAPPIAGRFPPGCPFHPRCPSATAECSSSAPQTTGMQGHDFRCHHPLGASLS
ncbi:methionine ABC transporter ATP-binding protein [Bordetella sp. N]|nr:ABC transporter ATP-binding protein [Bordetella sp. N]ALM86960.1 methionine ABC transporter ATP-binding protein [Bordetella sp. N]